MRILVTVKPRMYRESLALSLHRNRPHFEVMLAPDVSLDGQAEGFWPHLLVRNDTDGVDMDLMGTSVAGSRYSTPTAWTARVSLDGEVWNIKDITTEDLLEIADRTEGLMLEGTLFG